MRSRHEISRGQLGRSSRPETTGTNGGWLQQLSQFCPGTNRGVPNPYHGGATSPRRRPPLPPAAADTSQAVMVGPWVLFPYMCCGCCHHAFRWHRWGAGLPSVLRLPSFVGTTTWQDNLGCVWFSSLFSWPDSWPDSFQSGSLWPGSLFGCVDILNQAR
jgi:hypothetical protein